MLPESVRIDFATNYNHKRAYDRFTMATRAREHGTLANRPTISHNQTNLPPLSNAPTHFLGLNIAKINSHHVAFRLTPHSTRPRSLPARVCVNTRSASLDVVSPYIHLSRGTVLGLKPRATQCPTILISKRVYICI